MDGASASSNDGRPSEPTTLAAFVQTDFSFLLELGFRCVVESENSVRYERSDDTFVRVFRDWRDEYVGFRIGRSSQPKDALTATELAKLSGVTVHTGQLPERADDLQASVAQIAQELRAHGQRPLLGDTGIYEEAKELRRAYTSGFTGQTTDPSGTPP